MNRQGGPNEDKNQVIAKPVFPPIDITDWLYLDLLSPQTRKRLDDWKESRLREEGLKA